MKILIDLQAQQTQSRYRGIGRYSLELTKSILQLGTNHEFIVLFNSSNCEELDDVVSTLRDCDCNVDIKYFDTLKNISELVPEHQGEILVSELIRDNFIESLKPEYILVTSLIEGTHGDFIASVSGRTKIPTGIVGYDLIPLTDKDNYLGTEQAQSWYNRKCESIFRSDHIFTISESVSEEFGKLLDINEEKLVNISSAVDDRFKILGDDYLENSILSSLSVDNEYILYTGALDSRKNLSLLLESYARLKSSLRDKHSILLVGKYDEHDKIKILTQVKKLGINKNNIVFSGYITDEQLVQLYNHAYLFVFPSKHEGFGLPVLEAMACGIPTICSNSTSLPEVMGDDAAMFDPNSVDSLYPMLERALTDQNYRSWLKAHAEKRTKLFSWDYTAKTLLQTIESIETHHNEVTHLDYKMLIEEIAQLANEYNFDDTTLIRVSKCISSNQIRLDKRVPTEKLNWRIEGPFDSSYSLALLNRETARALDALGQNVVLHSTEGPGDFIPNLEFLQKTPDINALYQKSLMDNEMETNEVVSRNLYPPRVSEMNGEIKLLHHYAWEESGFPQHWVKEFNNHLSGMTCLSEHVRKIMIDNGVNLPMITSGCGTDHWLRIQPDQDYSVEGKAFRFLHVSSCFPRKGVNILLDAFGKAFTKEDDVSLVIKTFENPHNTLIQDLEQRRKDNPRFPDVVVIFDDITEAQLKAVYESCDILVAPSLAEGFGLPMAEAIYSGLGVVTNSWGGQLDFCNSETAWLINYEFEPVDSHFNIPNSVWARPNLESLTQTLLEVYYTDRSEIKKKIDAALKLLNERFKWEDVALNLINYVDKIKASKFDNKNLHIGWVSTWNERCGIASYSEHLVHKIESDITVFAPELEDDIQTKEASNIIRCWKNNNRDDLENLKQSILDSKVTAVIIQMNYNFYDYNALTNLIEELKHRNIVVVIMLHSTKDPSYEKRLLNISDVLKLCDRVMVHTVKDLNRLKYIGVISNACIFPHGIELIEENGNKLNKSENKKKIVATYGFALPHKGILELIEAFNKICDLDEDLELLLLNAEHSHPSSAEFISEINKLVLEFNIGNRVRVINDYLEEEESIELLSQADLIVMPYQQTGESSSAAVRTALASGSPVIVTPLDIFDDVSDAVIYLNGISPDEIATGIKSFMNGNLEWDIDKANNWKSYHSYDIVATRLHNIIGSLMINSTLN
ncbi:glycosyltransferase [Vibrio sp. 10N.261.51.F11]|uniref:glycosyltransferase n=1 Tax=Vibrio sp. 10N.261.51.F11 TaxID=3229678 RepID=UPI00354CC6C8